MVNQNERPDEIKRFGKLFESQSRLEEWNPPVAKHSEAVPVANVVTALGLESFVEDGMLYMERIDRVGNVYYTFEHEENSYDMFLIPMPEGWALVRDHESKDIGMEVLVGGLEDVLKYDVHMRHIAPLEDIIRVVAEQNAPSTAPYTGPSQAEILRRHREGG